MYTMTMLWLGTWHLEASRFWIEMADRMEGSDG
jgi:hypothetical protein